MVVPAHETTVEVESAEREARSASRASRSALGAPHVALGPEMPGWGSWEWIGAGLAEELGRYCRTSIFPAGAVPDADAVIVIKHAPTATWVEAVSRRAAVIFCPVDHYGSAAQIDADAAMLRWCARIVVHCEQLRRYFEPYAPVVYMDHCVKFVPAVPVSYRTDGFILWTGVRTNVAALAEWVNEHPLPGELLVLTNLPDVGRICNPSVDVRVIGQGRIGNPSYGEASAADFGFRGAGVRIENWTKERHIEAAAQARAAIDIKGQDFRSRHKPPAKAIDFLACGLPLAMNEDICVVRHLAGMGFDVASPLDTERWLSREYWEETRRFGGVLRELLSRERVGRRWRIVIGDVLGEGSRQ
jgi:hypothetical protein